MILQSYCSCSSPFPGVRASTSESKPFRTALPRQTIIRALPDGSQMETQDPLPTSSEEMSIAAAASSFGRRVAIGLSAASGVAVGGNLVGVTSFLLGLNAGLSRGLRLDVLYPVQGFKRCLEKDFEFIYPATWVGDQRLLYRAVEKAERQRIYGLGKDQKPGVVEPIVAFGPPGSSGELNVSVIVAPVPRNFRLDEIGEPKEVGEVILKDFIAMKSPNVLPLLINAEKKSDNVNGQELLYYKLEFSVEGPSFLRHNVSVYVTHNGKLFSMSAQTPESLWPSLQANFLQMADSFKVIS